MTLKVGDTAPDFTLLSNEDQKVTLNSFRGKNVVLLFFPMANTSVCTKELCTMRDSIGDYSNLNAQVLAISVDSHLALKMWNEKNNFNFPLLSDFNKEICGLYGAQYDIWLPGKFDYKGVAKRSAFVIDKKGVIQYAEVLENAGEEPNYNAVKETLNKLN